MLLGTTHAWLDAITDGRSWDEGRDTPRVAQAFRTLARTVRRWPAPAEFLEALPPVEVVAIGYEAKPVSEEEKAANIAKLKALLAEGAYKPVPPDKIERTTTPEDRKRIESDLRRHYDGRTAAAGPDA